MNIKQQIFECVRSPPSKRNFAFSASTDDVINRFQREIEDFLNSNRYDEAVDKARPIYFSMLDLHDKLPTLLPTVEGLNRDELYGAYTFDRRRLHFCHQANVFLLGLYIYHNFEPLRKQICLEMENTTVEIPREGMSFRYSGNDAYGEFLYRWRLSSLCHDIGTGIQLCEGDRKKIAELLPRFCFRSNISSVDELRIFNNNDLLADLDKASGNIKFSAYLQYHENHPSPNKVCHDHGIMGSLIFLQLMQGAYLHHNRFPISTNTFGMEVFWHPEILTHSIIQIALAIAMHNFGSYREALGHSSTEMKIFNLYRNPLAWLLKVADALQEWDKPAFEHAQTEQDLVTNLQIFFTGSTIEVVNFPEDKIDKTATELKSITYPEIIKFV